MRNGIYRLWFQGSAEGAGATLFVDGQMIACDSTHAYLGHYKDMNGCFTAELRMTRHTMPLGGDQRPDDCVLHLEGLAAEETVAARSTVAEMPDFETSVEYVWISEA